jgi:serine/threonine-protein kinase HipA
MRTGETATQALALNRSSDRTSSLETLVKAAADYRLDRRAARELAEGVVDSIESHWVDAVEFAEINEANRDLMWKRMFLNPGSVRNF